MCPANRDYFRMAGDIQSVPLSPVAAAVAVQVVRGRWISPGRRSGRRPPGTEQRRLAGTGQGDAGGKLQSAS